MTITSDTLRAIGRAVQRAGGDMTDVDELVAVWNAYTATGSHA